MPFVLCHFLLKTKHLARTIDLKEFSNCSVQKGGLSVAWGVPPSMCCAAAGLVAC